MTIPPHQKISRKGTHERRKKKKQFDKDNSVLLIRTSALCLGIDFFTNFLLSVSASVIFYCTVLANKKSFSLIFL